MRLTIAAMTAAALATFSAHAGVIYGLTATSIDEGNARIVCFDTSDLSDDPDTPTPLQELATVAGANDFMGGCSAGDLYYGYYNITDMETQSVTQYFCTIDFETGEAHILRALDPTMSDDGIYLIDMTYEPETGMIVALENQYSPSTQEILTSVQAVHPQGGSLSLLHDFDAKYSAICADGEGGYYIAQILRIGDGQGNPVFFKADRNFSLTRLMPPKPGLIAESSMAHSMVMMDGKLYLVTGHTVTVVNLSTKSTTSYYLDREVYGATSVPGKASINVMPPDALSPVCLEAGILTLPVEARVEAHTPQGCLAAVWENCRQADLNTLGKGIHIIRVSNDDGVATMKVRL